MKNSKDIILKRQEKILDILNVNFIVYVDKLSLILNVSPITIRRDLDVFQKRGIVKKFYGGAMLIRDNFKPDPSLDTNKDTENKLNIAKYAASLIDDGDTIFINSSSTALLLLNYIGDKKVTVVTNNARAIELDLSLNTELILTGGHFHKNKQTMVSEFAINNLSKTTANKAFLGISGIDYKAGLSTSSLGETSINELMLRRCNGTRYILADSSKIGCIHNFYTGDISLIDVFITDSHADNKHIENFKNAGVSVVLTDF